MKPNLQDMSQRTV
ncbi:hypothetical protein F383_30330 [Gossypium arboreum]|uniref:Uncharacterized protein n=1 Tax=Gossypium arboreum TaxID=29729 RepID=A0A0B0MZN7_GOSAR|nr:hypothetical protein F383_30330 [Gossypium arboreum]